MRVLVVDDDVAGRDLLSVALADRGWDVVTAEDGERALGLARQSAPDVCVSDILMPGMDGYRLCREWRTDPDLCPIPFVFYTATYTSQEDEEFALSLGADGFVVKPADIVDLVDTIDAVVCEQDREAARAAPCAEPESETDVLRRYNERLVRKLEHKLIEVRVLNSELRHALETLSDEVGVKHELIERLDGQLGRAADLDRFDEVLDERTVELRRVNVQLEQAAQAKSKFVAGMGHEMRNKLNSIIGFSGILQQGLVGEMSEEQLRQVDMIYAAGQSMLALVNDVVDLSKIEAGDLEMRIAQFELLGFAEGIIESFRATAEAKGIQLELVAPAGVMPMNSDRAKIEQVLRNLLSNAVKFTDDGGVKLEVEPSGDGRRVTMRVRDSGRGISPEVMGRVFDEFVKRERDESLGTGGTGLGLALTRRLCEMLGGNVSAKSNPGEGSVFAVELPVDATETTTRSTGTRAERVDR